MSSTFYERLLSHRAEGESLTAFAARIGVSESALNRWARGGRPNSPFFLSALAERLGVGVCWLAYGREAVAPEASRIRD